MVFYARISGAHASTKDISTTSGTNMGAGIDKKNRLVSEVSGKTGKKKKDQVPIFLKKSFHMIDTCDPAIACWSEDGSNFVIKDPDTLACDVFPHFYKHQNFSSFVRQLNFYGFKKVKHDPIRVGSKTEQVESKCWRFRHEFFRRGRPDLLPEIKKAMQSSSTEEKGVESLRAEVKTLRSQTSSMSQEIEGLNRLVKSLLLSVSVINDKLELIPSKGVDFDPVFGTVGKRKRTEWDCNMPELALSVDGTLVAENTCSEAQCSPEIDTIEDNMNPDADFMTSLVASCDTTLEEACEYPDLPNSHTPRRESVGAASLASHDTLFLNEILHVPSKLERENLMNSSDLLLEATPNSAVSSSPAPGLADTKDPTGDDRMNRKFRKALQLLPQKMQELFVDRLVATIQDPDNFQYHVDAISELAKSASVDGLQERFGGRQDGNDDEPSSGSQASVDFPAATLAAYLREYAEIAKKGMSNQDKLHGQEGIPIVVPFEV